MGDLLVAVPLGAGDLSQLTATDSLTGYAVTPTLKATFGLDERDEDQAERAAVLLASVAALASWGQRRAASLLVRADQVTPAADLENGEVTVTGLVPSQVLAWFADGPEVDVHAAAAAARGRSVDDAWNEPAVSALVMGHDLLWHDVAETQEV